MSPGDYQRWPRNLGRAEKIPLLTTDLAEALTVADEDIEEHWEAYKTQYLKGRPR